MKLPAPPSLLGLSPQSPERPNPDGAVALGTAPGNVVHRKFQVAQLFQEKQIAISTPNQLLSSQ